eukprot:3940483-Rhodomonas_salina.4
MPESTAREGNAVGVLENSVCEERGVAIYMCCAGSMIAVCCARRGVVLVGDVVLTRRMVHTAVRNDCRGMELKAVKPVRSFQIVSVDSLAGTRIGFPYSCAGTAIGNAYSCAGTEMGRVVPEEAGRRLLWALQERRSPKTRGLNLTIFRGLQNIS